MSLEKFVWVLAVALSIFMQGPASQAETLTVAVTANMKYTFGDLSDKFRRESGIETKGVFGSAGKIVSQVRNGAPFDVFLSADTDFPDALYKDGLATAQSRVYAYGTLVLWTGGQFDLGKGMSILSDPAIHKIAICNPEVGVYGQAAVKAMKSAGLDLTDGAKLVYADSLTQAAQFVDSGVAEIGFLSKSIAIAPAMAGKGKWVEIPKNSYPPIAQGVVILKHGAANRVDAQRFVDFLFTQKARSIFEKYGYLLP